MRRIADNDPRTYLWLKDGNLNEIANNLAGEFADRTCCVLAVRGSLVREERTVAAALTRSILEGGDLGQPAIPTDAAAVYAGYGGRGSAGRSRRHDRKATPITTIRSAPLSRSRSRLYTEELKP